MWRHFGIRLLICLGILGSYSKVESAKIFAIFAYQSQSHYFCIKPIIHELIRRGHEVTVASGTKEENMTSNYRHIQIDARSLKDLLTEKLPSGVKLTLEKIIENTAYDLIDALQDSAVLSLDVYLNSTDLRDFTLNSKENFDLVLTELFYNDAFYAYAHHFDAPLVLLSTFGNSAANNVFMGNPISFSQTAHEFFDNVEDLSLFQRFRNLFLMSYDLTRRRMKYYPLINKGLNKYFSHSKTPIPNIEDISRNVSLTLINSHFSADLYRAQVPSIIEIGGVHIGKTQKLPKDIQLFLDEAVHGAVYFSLGTTFDFDDPMAIEKMTTTLNVFAKLKQRFIVKCNIITTNIPPNILMKEWLPQTDILAHPNLKVFITHAGLLSSEEAVHFGVPTLGIPIFGDQYRNAQLAVVRGSGLMIHIKDLEEDNFLSALLELLENPKYKNKSLEVSRMFRDRPLSPLDTVIYWIEYVIRHKGAAHLKAGLRNTVWFKEYSIDIFFVVFTVLAIFIFVLHLIYKALRKFFLLVFSKGKKISKQKKS